MYELHDLIIQKISTSITKLSLATIAVQQDLEPTKFYSPDIINHNSKSFLITSIELQDIVTVHQL